MAFGEEDIRSRFGSHRVTEETKPRHDRVRIQFTDLALLLDELLPDGRDKSLCFTHLEDAAMRANRAISHNNRLT